MDESLSDPARIEVVGDEYAIGCAAGLPFIYDAYKEHATLVEEHELGRTDTCCVTVARVADDWPFLVVAQGYAPAGYGFYPGVLLVPDTKRLFIGAGERLLGYALDPPARLWEDRADMGFWNWRRHGEVVLMSAELELAAWDVHGRKLWTTFAEPPWGYTVENGTVQLDVMGEKRSFSLSSGPA
jgi:L-alanine-DL-glutamate epimerase-like enolase superfamily enzyme